MERRRTFSREFKLEAVRLVTERGVAVAQTAKDLAVASRTIIWPLEKQIRVLLVPLFHALHRRLAAQC